MSAALARVRKMVAHGAELADRATRSRDARRALFERRVDRDEVEMTNAVAWFLGAVYGRGTLSHEELSSGIAEVMRTNSVVRGGFALTAVRLPGRRPRFDVQFAD